MGASNCPETPRQKMIGMMYLVLTAMLALNVSKDILEAFVVVNEAVEQSNTNLLEKNGTSYVLFQQDSTINPEKVRPYIDTASVVKLEIEEMVEYIEAIKFELIMKTEKLDNLDEAKAISLRDVKSKDNFDIPTNYMCGNDHELHSDGNGEGAKLRKRIDEFNARMLEICDVSRIDPTNILDTSEINRVFAPINVDPIENDIQGTMSWVQSNFYHTVLAADVVLLNKLIQDVRGIEYDVVKHLHNQVSANDFKFDKIEAKVVSQNNMLFSGDVYEAEIFVAAYDSKSHPEILIEEGLDSVIDAANFSSKEGLVTLANEDFKEGVGTYSVPASGSGVQKFAGVIKVNKPGSNETKSYPFESYYTVLPPSATVSATKMNVFYIGLDNPVSVSVPGVSAENVQVSVSGASIVPNGNGLYTVRATTPGRVSVNVSAKVGNKTQSMGSFEYRCLNIPKPTPFACGTNMGYVSKGTIRAIPNVSARLENFVFADVRFTIVSFTFSAQTGIDLQEYQIQGNTLSGPALNAINSVNRNGKIFFENIRAVGPDGRTVKLSDIILRIS